MEKSFVSLSKLVLGAILCILFGSILYFKPHWGLMDDSYLSSIVLPLIHENGLWNYTVFFTKGDAGHWGMFRPLYPTMAYFVYSPGVKFAPYYSFLLNLFLSIAILIHQTHVLSKILKISIWPTLLFLSAFFYQYDLFQYPSLQEKMVLLAGSVFIQLCYAKFSSFWVQLLVLTLAIVVGASTKASFMIFYSLGFWALLSSQSQNLFVQKKIQSWILLGVVGFLGLAAIYFLGKISAQGSYTQQYDLAKVIPNLVSKEGVLFLVPLALGAFNLWFLWKKQKLRWEDALPLIGIAAFLTLFLPWGIKAYIQSVIGPVYAALWVTILFGMFSFVPQRLWLLPLMMLCLLIASYRSFSMFARLGDLGKIVNELKEDRHPQVKTIWVPCMEGTDSFRRFVNEKNPGRFEVRFWQTVNEPNGKFVFFDNALCPLPNRADTVENCQVEILSQGSWKKSFRLANLKCPN